MSEDNNSGGSRGEDQHAPRRISPAQRQAGEDALSNGRGEDLKGVARQGAPLGRAAPTPSSKPAPTPSYLSNLKSEVEELERLAALSEEASLLERKRAAEERLRQSAGSSSTPPSRSANKPRG